MVRDRAWFFTAGRWQETENQITLQETNLPFPTTNENRRFEIKGTGTLAPNHTLMGNYIRNSTDVTGLPFGFTIDPNIQRTRASRTTCSSRTTTAFERSRWRRGRCA